jgi:hypothetical protein
MYNMLENGPIVLWKVSGLWICRNVDTGAAGMLRRVGIWVLHSTYSRLSVQAIRHEGASRSADGGHSQGKQLPVPLDRTLGHHTTGLDMVVKRNAPVGNRISAVQTAAVTLQTELMTLHKH